MQTYSINPEIRIQNFSNFTQLVPSRTEDTTLVALKEAFQT